MNPGKTREEKFHQLAGLVNLKDLQRTTIYTFIVSIKAHQRTS